MSKVKPRGKVPKKATIDEVIEIKTLIRHPMHSGRMKDKDGKNIPCWSLFYMAKKRKDWGFKVDGKWIQHEEYLNKKEVRPEPTRYGTWEVKGREIDF